VRNPIVRAREEYGLSRRQLALASGLPYHRVYLVERALTMSVPAKLLSTLQELGRDPCTLAREYEQYLDELRRQALDEARTCERR